MSLSLKLAFIFFLFNSVNLFSQNEDSISNLILKKKYNIADSLLKKSILEQESVSSEITFLFGKNSYFLKKYEQSINWLNKYLELKGQDGFFSDESIKFLELSNAKNLTEIDKNIENVYVELYSYNYIDCSSNKKICPICDGSSVMIVETEISKIYKTCPFSDNKGFLTCDEYNLFLRGKLKPKNTY